MRAPALSDGLWPLDRPYSHRGALSEPPRWLHTPTNTHIPPKTEWGGGQRAPVTHLGAPAGVAVAYRAMMAGRVAGARGIALLRARGLKNLVN